MFKRWKYFKRFVISSCVYKHMHIQSTSHYNSSDRIKDLASYAIYVVCVLILYTNWLRTLDFWEIFHGNSIIYSQSFWEKSAEKKLTKKYFFSFCWWCLTWIWILANTLSTRLRPYKLPAKYIFNEETFL